VFAQLSLVPPPPLLAACAAAKSAKKNKKRAAKRKDEAGSQWDTSSANGSIGVPPLEESACQASMGWDNSAAARDDVSVASTGRYITSKWLSLGPFLGRAGWAVCRSLTKTVCWASLDGTAVLLL
jgi:hypothetical protein